MKKVIIIILIKNTKEIDDNETDSIGAFENEFSKVRQIYCPTLTRL